MRRLAALLIVVATLLAGTLSLVAADEAPPVLPAVTIDDSRSAVPWTPEAGRFTRTGDVAAAPDGTLYALDVGQDAIHVLYEGVPLARWARVWGEGGGAADGDPPEADRWRARRLDVGQQGRLHVLLSGPVAAGARAGRVLVLEPAVGAEGRISETAAISATFELSIPAQERYADLAVAPDGRILVVHTSGDIHDRGTYGIDVIDPRAPEAPALRSQPEDLWIPVSVDVDAAGMAWIVARSTHDHVPGSTAFHGLDAIYGFAPEAFASEPETELSPTPTRALPFPGAMDVSVGAAGLLVSQDAQIVRVPLDGGEPEIVHTGPLAERTHYTEPPLGAHNVFALDQQADGRIVASVDHCAFQGLTLIDGGLVHRVGAQDRPRLAGPVLPWRIAVDEKVALLQERFEDPPRNAEGWPRSAARSASIVFAPHTVQHWDADGRLIDQTGACGSWTDPLAVRDVGRDGDALYTLTEDRLRWHGDPDDGADGLVLRDGASWLAAGSTDPDAAAHGFALDAWGGVPVVLDLGQDLLLWPSDLTARPGPRTELEALRASDPSRRETLPRDVATRDDAVFVLDGDGRVRAVRGGGDGVAARLAEAPAAWDAPGSPIAIALDGWFVYGPGRVALLHRGGWLTVHEAWTGDLLATIPPVDPAESVRDLSVDAAGRVHVAWVDAHRQRERSNAPPRTTGAETIVRRAGIRTYELQGLNERVWPDDRPPRALPERGACLVAPALAAPEEELALGEPVTVTLRLDAQCPPAPPPLDLALVVEVSQATAANGGIDRARAAAVRLLTLLGGEVRTSLTTFDDAVLHHTPLAEIEERGLPGIARRLAALEGTTRDSRGITEALRVAAMDLGAQPLRGNRALLLLTDGRAPLPDMSRDILDNLVDLHVLVVPGLPLPWTSVEALEATFGGTQHVHLDATPEGLAELADVLRAGDGALPEVELVEVDIDVGLPPGWRLAPHTGGPDADVAPRVDGDRLRWHLREAANGSTLRWRIVPDWPGLRPVATTPVVSWRDAGGHEGGWSLHSPKVRVAGAITLWLPRLIGSLTPAP